MNKPFRHVPKIISGLPAVLPILGSTTRIIIISFNLYTSCSPSRHFWEGELHRLSYQCLVPSDANYPATSVESGGDPAQRAHNGSCYSSIAQMS
jgi:hypothetical protein